jgi:uncharacterized protein
VGDADPHVVERATRADPTAMADRPLVLAGHRSVRSVPVSAWAVLGVGAAVALGAAAQQLVGFGFALLAMPFLTALVGPQDAVAVAAFGSLAGGGVMAWRLRHLTDRRRLRRLVVGMVPGLPLGVVALANLPDAPLRVAVAVVVLIMVGVLATGFHLRSERPAAEVGAGFVSGALGGSIGISGPPVVLVLQAARMEQHAFRATTAGFFTVSNVMILPLLLGSGVVGVDIWPAALVAVPSAILSNWGCEGLARRITPERFRPLVLAMLVVAAAVALASAA